MRPLVCSAVMSILLLPLSLKAQNYSKAVSNSTKSILLEVDNSEVTISGQSSDQIELEVGTIGDSKSKDSRAEGLEVVSPWVDNTGLGFSFTEELGVLRIRKTVHSIRMRIKISIPKNMALTVRETEWRNGSFIIKDLSNDLDIKTNSSDVEISQVGGDIHAKTTSGNLNINLAGNNTGDYFDFDSVSGEIKIKVGSAKGSNLDIQTISGSIESEYEIKSEIEYKGSVLTRVGRVKNIETELNGGGAKIKANTVSGLVRLIK